VAGAPWGRLRYAIAEANLARHLDGLGEGPLRILDLGGGDGGDAIRLAARGHHVTIADYAPAMLAAAAERASAHGLTDSVTCVQADVSDLPRDLTAEHSTSSSATTSFSTWRAPRTSSLRPAHR
jgi:S-adenosylmethionine-dependent methyltransferase